MTLASTRRSSCSYLNIEDSRNFRTYFTSLTRSGLNRQIKIMLILYTTLFKEGRVPTCMSSLHLNVQDLTQASIPVEAQKRFMVALDSVKAKKSPVVDFAVGKPLEFVLDPNQGIRFNDGRYVNCHILRDRCTCLIHRHVGTDVLIYFFKQINAL